VRSRAAAHGRTTGEAAIGSKMAGALTRFEVFTVATQDDGVETTVASGGIVVVITAAHLSPILSILFGILILIVPRFLNYLVAVYLILVGLLGLGIVRM